MRAPSFAVVGLSAVLLAQQCEAGDLQNIRPRDFTAELLLRFGTERSVTFRDMVEDLERSQVVVYIDVRQQTEHSVGGRLQFLNEAQGIRWVRITVDSGTSLVNRTHQDIVRLTAILGHELQHALEAGDAASMRDEGEFERYFRRIGVPEPDTLDTLAAREVGALVDNELRDSDRGLVDDQVSAWRRAHSVD